MAEATPVPRGDRMLGIDANEADGETYDQAFQLARQAGMQFTSLSLAWDDLEPRPGEYSPDPNFLAIANQYYPAKDVPLALTITPIDTSRRRLPADLKDAAFDDPEVITRFERLLDYVFSQIPDVELAVLAIGNEVDATLGMDAAAWARYRTFYESTAAYARSLRPGVPVGVKVTMAGLTGERRQLAQALNERSDIILVTYYPLEADFSVRPADVVLGDLAALAALFPDRPIGVLEAGYPSSTKLESSEAKQAEFVRQIFRAWDAHAGQLALLNFTWLTDVPSASVEAWTDYYGLDDRRFAAYLATLGLRGADGEPKPALDALAAEAHARGW
ncbi:MAG: hypothetical protein FJZ97_06760 [Chloroflexi bacterium]|nr:hypothetical protein [Chloroflexota bacterium]